MKNKITIAAILLTLTMNPWSVGYAGLGVEIALKYFTIYSIYGFILGMLGLLGISIWNMITSREKVSIPKKSKTTSKAGKYEKTPVK